MNLREGRRQDEKQRCRRLPQHKCPGQDRVPESARGARCAPTS